MTTAGTRPRRLLGMAVVHGGRPRPGRPLVVRLPDGVVAVKRAVRRDPDGWWVEADNAAEGVDSRTVGAIADEHVVAHVLMRIWPRPRRV